MQIGFNIRWRTLIGALGIIVIGLQVPPHATSSDEDTS